MKRSRLTYEQIRPRVIDALSKGLKSGNQLDHEVKSRVQYSLPRLEREGWIRDYPKGLSHRQGPRGKRRWGLTVKGFLSFLSRHRKSIRDVVRAAEAYGSLLTYPVIDYQETEREVNGVPELTIGPPRLVDIPLLPIRYQRTFRDRVGNKTYVQSLTVPFVETDLPWYSYALEKRSKRGKETIPHEDIIARFDAQKEQEQYALAFTLRFLSNVFHQPRQTRWKPYPDKEAHDYLRELFESKIGELNQRRDSVVWLRRNALDFFNPDRSDRRNKPTIRPKTR